MVLIRSSCPDFGGVDMFDGDVLGVPALASRTAGFEDLLVCCCRIRIIFFFIDRCCRLRCEDHGLSRELEQ